MISRPKLVTVDNIDVAELTELEQQIEHAEHAERNAYLARGRALGKIRDGKLYRARYNFATFEEYCKERWELDEGTVYRLIAAADFGEKVAHGRLSMPTRERHIRPLLAQLDNDDDRIAVWRDVLDKAEGERIHATDVEDAISRFVARRDDTPEARDEPDQDARFAPASPAVRRDRFAEHVTLEDWKKLDAGKQLELLTVIGNKGLNRQTNTDIEWADWSWNPITGCLHDCPYCYARDIAVDIYPEDVEFNPTFWPDRLTAPANQRVPDGADDDVARKNIFTGSMGDLWGPWVPDQWIERVLAEVEANPQWNFLFLTKFPQRMAQFEIPPNAWMGTTVDLQKRVANAEKAFAKIKASVRWLSCEPMVNPLQFKRLDLFDWVVIGGASPSKATAGSPATPAWNVPIDWLADLHQKARAANCRIYYKTNSGLTGPYTRIREFPGKPVTAIEVPEVFNYLRSIPKKEQIG